jgi:uncharacterized protein (DUF486 family)
VVRAPEESRLEAVWIAALLSWSIALAVFVPFAVLYMGQEIRLNFLYAGFCLMGAVYFIFRG